MLNHFFKKNVTINFFLFFYTITVHTNLFSSLWNTICCCCPKEHEIDVNQSSNIDLHQQLQERLFPYMAPHLNNNFNSDSDTHSNSTIKSFLISEAMHTRSVANFSDDEQ